MDPRWQTIIAISQHNNSSFLQAKALYENEAVWSAIKKDMENESVDENYLFFEKVMQLFKLIEHGTDGQIKKAWNDSESNPLLRFNKEHELHSEQLDKKELKDLLLQSVNKASGVGSSIAYMVVNPDAPSPQLAEIKKQAALFKENMEKLSAKTDKVSTGIFSRKNLSTIRKIAVAISLILPGKGHVYKPEHVSQLIALKNYLKDPYKHVCPAITGMENNFLNALSISNLGPLDKRKLNQLIELITKIENGLKPAPAETKEHKSNIGVVNMFIHKPKTRERSGAFGNNDEKPKQPHRGK